MPWKTTILRDGLFIQLFGEHSQSNSLYCELLCQALIVYANHL